MKKKVIGIGVHQPAKEIFTDKLPLAKLRKIWNDQNITYTDEQLIRIREWLYMMAEVIMGTVNDNPHLLIDLNIKQHEKEESNALHESTGQRTAA